MPTSLPSDLQTRLSERGYLLADGAMGTRLMASGLLAGALPERWNRDRAESVIAVHSSYIASGSDIILTNSFGGTVPRLAMHDGADELEELNVAAVSCARTAIARSGRVERVYVAGSMGPTGQLLSPLGELSESAMEELYYAQATALAEGGADLLWIETQMDLGELRTAMRAAHRTGLPYCGTMSFDTAGKTMMGVSPEDVVSFCTSAETMEQLHPWGIGLNCGLAASDTLVSLKRLTTALAASNGADAASGSTPIVIVKGNLGVPQWQAGAFRYSGDEKTMGDYAELARALGAGVIGSCCGSDAGHVHRMGCVLAAGAGIGAGAGALSYQQPPSVDDIERILGARKTVDEADESAVKGAAKNSGSNSGKDSVGSTAARRARAAGRRAQRDKP